MGMSEAVTFRFLVVGKMVSDDLDFNLKAIRMSKS